MPYAVTQRLADYREARRKRKTKELTLTDLLSIESVKQEFADNSDAEAALAGPVDPLAPEPAKGTGKRVVTYVSPEVNRKIRQELLKQNPFTNRFEGSFEAARAERQYHIFIDKKNFVRVRSRLVVTALCLILITGVESVILAARQTEAASINASELKTPFPGDNAPWEARMRESAYNRACDYRLMPTYIVVHIVLPVVSLCIAAVRHACCSATAVSVPLTHARTHARWHHGTAARTPRRTSRQCSPMRIARLL